MPMFYVIRNQNTYHWLVGVLLELDQPHAGHVRHLPVFGAVRIVAIQIRRQRRRRDAQRLLAVHFSCDHVVRVQKGLCEKTM